MQALIENLLGEASLQARKVGEAAVVVDDVVRTVRERGEQLERVVVREGLARLQTRDAASLQQVKSNLSVNHKGQGGTEGRGCGEALQVRRSCSNGGPASSRCNYLELQQTHTTIPSRLSQRNKCRRRERG